MPTRGIHLIGTTYRTWPPGDERGHWSPLFDLYGRLAEAGHQLRLPDADTRRHAEEIAKEPQKVLSPREVDVVADTFGRALGATHSPPLVAGRSTFRPPVIYAAAIERTHLHLLTGILREDVGTFIGRLKGMASSAVGALPENEGRTRVWTAHYWEVFLFDDAGLDAVQAYVERHNVRRGLPAAPYSCVHPRRVRK